MKKGNRLLLILCIVLMMFSMVACAPEKKEEIKESENTGIVLRDALDREVVLEKPAESVVSSYYIATTTLIALGAEEQLVGIEMKAKDRMIYQLAAPEIIELPAMGNKKEFNVEECARISPDLVVLPLSLKDFVEPLETLNIPVIVVNPETMEEFKTTVTLLGQATGHKEEAETLLNYYQDVENSIAAMIGEADNEKTVYFASGSDILRMATGSMFQNEVIKAAKGSPVSSDFNDHNWAEVSLEQLLAFDPAYIFVENGSKELVEEVMNDARFASLRAVKDGHVYSFPSALETWDTPSPSSVMGILWMSSVLYPGVLPMEQVVEEAMIFYQNFYEIDVDEKQLGLQ